MVKLPCSCEIKSERIEDFRLEHTTKLDKYYCPKTDKSWDFEEAVKNKRIEWNKHRCDSV